MTRAEAKAAMDAGKKIGWENGAYAFYDLEHEYGPYIFVFSDGLMDFMSGAWSRIERAFILPERKTRPCTQLEILAIQTKPNRVARYKKDIDDVPMPACGFCIYEYDSVDFQWAEFNQDGTLGPWHDFVVEVEE